LARQKELAMYKSFFVNTLIAGYFSWVMSYTVALLATGETPTMAQPAWVVGAVIFALLLGFGTTMMPHSLGKMLIYRTNPMLKNQYRAIHWTGLSAKFSNWFLVAILLTTCVMGWLLTDMSFRSLLSLQGMQGAKRIFMAMGQPRWDILGMVLEAMVVTIFIALMATLMAIPVAFVASFYMARNLSRHSPLGRFLYSFLRGIANLTRSIEPLIWAVIFSVWVGIGPFAGMLALMLHSIASLSKLYSEQIENIDQGPLEAIEATGANRVQVIWYAVVPQVLLPYLSYTIYRWDINIRMATIIGMVGGGGVGTLLMQYQGLAKWNEVGTIVLIIAIVVWFMDYLSSKIRTAIY
jgi:phosphonate transport system permease protein